jgi:hypothetical protein
LTSQFNDGAGATPKARVIISSITRHEIGLAASGVSSTSLIGEFTLSHLNALAKKKRDIRIRILDADLVVSGLKMLVGNRRILR